MIYNDKHTDDVDFLFEMDDVDVLDKNTVNLKKTPEVKVRKQTEENTEDHPEFMMYDEQIEREEVKIKALPRATEGFTRKVYTLEKFCAARASINEKTFKNLASGKISYEDVYDMHGLTEDDAYQSLYLSLNRAYHQGLRCVIIVHGKGKGYGPNGTMGLLKAKTPEWLDMHPAVLAYHTTLPKHGGTGAVYVLIRKEKEPK